MTFEPKPKELTKNRWAAMMTSSTCRHRRSRRRHAYSQAETEVHHRSSPLINLADADVRLFRKTSARPSDLHSKHACQASNTAKTGAIQTSPNAINAADAINQEWRFTTIKTCANCAEIVALHEAVHLIHKLYGDSTQWGYKHRNSIESPAKAIQENR